MSDHKRELEDIQKELSVLDSQMLSALEKRARQARRLRELRVGHAAQIPLHDRAHIAAIVARASGDMPPEDLRAVFREVYAACLALELPVKIGYLGPEGGPSYAAARLRFGASADFQAVDSVIGLLDEVARRRVEFALMPLETRSEGPVQSTIQALSNTELRIVSVLESTFDAHLMNRTGNDADVEKVYATAADHARATDFLATLPRRPPVLDVKSPLIACKLAAEDHGAAALVMEAVGLEQGLAIARRSVLDGGAEAVRYAVVGSRPASRSGADATALVFSVHDKPGALLDVLKVFADRDINVSKIQSRPSPDEAWVYLFFVEISGHATDRAVISAFEEVKRMTRSLKVLGSYPTIV
jgi:chorismate mutase/prephenate dehydratase